MIYKLIVKGKQYETSPSIEAYVYQQLGDELVSLMSIQELPQWTETFIEIHTDSLNETTITARLNQWMNHHRYPPFNRGDLLWWTRSDEYWEEPQPVLEGVTIITPEGTGKGTLYSDDHLELDAHLEADYEDRHPIDTDIEM